MIRWKSLLLRLAGVGLLIVAANTLSSPIAEWLLVQSGQAVTGAKIDIGATQASLLQGRLEVKDLQIADPNDPLANLLQARSGEFHLSTGNALHRRWVIEKASLKGVQFGTPRTASGALTNRDHSGRESGAMHWVADVIHHNAAEASRVWLGQLESRLPTLIEDNLQTVRIGRELADRWPAEFDARRDEAVSLRDRAREIRALLQSKTDNPLRDLELYHSALQQSQAVLQEVDTMRQSVLSLKDQLAADQKALQVALAHDRQRVVAMTEGEALNGDALSSLLLGKATAQQTREIVEWVHTIRNLIPEADRDFYPVRSRGVDVEFAPRPSLLFRHLELDGEAMIGGQPTQFVAVVRNLSTHPGRVDEPTTIELRGQGNTHVHITATLDRRGSIPEDSIRIYCPTLSIPAQHLGDRDALLVALKAASLSLTADLAVRGDEIRGTLYTGISRTRLNIESADRIPNAETIVAKLNQQLSSLSGFSATVDIRGTLKQPRFQLQSDLGPQLAGAMSTAFQQQVQQAAETKLAQLDRIAARESDRIETLFQTKSSQILELLTTEVTSIANLDSLVSPESLPGRHFR